MLKLIYTTITSILIPSLAIFVFYERFKFRSSTGDFHNLIGVVVLSAALARLFAEVLFYTSAKKVVIFTIPVLVGFLFFSQSWPIYLSITVLGSCILISESFSKK